MRRLGSRAEWLRARRIGSSDVPALLGLSTHRGPYAVWERLVLDPEAPDLEDEADEDESAARGRALEPRILRTYARLLGERVVPTPPHALYEREEHSTSTPDAMRAGEVLVEVKTDRYASRWGEPQPIRRWSAEAAAVVRPDYYMQVQHQLWTCDLDRADLVVLVPGADPLLPELRVYPVERDPELVERLVERLRVWWRVHVEGGVPPAVDGSEAAARALARVPRDGARRATAGELLLAAGYETARAAEREARDTRRALGQLLTAAAGSSAALLLPRGRVSIVTSRGRSTLDEDALLEDHPDLAAVLDEYRRPGAPYSFPRVSGFGGR